jgi:hypothetical protein
MSKLFLGGGPSFAALSRPLSHTVQELFLREVEELETMLQRDLSAWKPLRGERSYTELSDLNDQCRATA